MIDCSVWLLLYMVVDLFDVLLFVIGWLCFECVLVDFVWIVCDVVCEFDVIV